MCAISSVYSLCKNVALENNNHMYSWSGFLPLTIVGESGDCMPISC